MRTHATDAAALLDSAARSLRLAGLSYLAADVDRLLSRVNTAATANDAENTWMPETPTRYNPRTGCGPSCVNCGSCRPRRIAR